MDVQMPRTSSRHSGHLSLMSPTAARKPLRIGIISEYFYPDSTGGTGTVLSDLARCLKDDHAELDLEVITSRNLYRCEAGSLADRDEWGGIKILRLPTPRPCRRSIPLRLAANCVFSSAVLLKLLTRPHYDLLLVATAPPTLPMAAKVFKHLTGTPYIYLIYDLYPDIAVALNVLPRNAPAPKMFQRLQRSWLHSASKTVVLGRCMQDYLAKSYGLSRDQIEVIPVGSDPDQVVPMSKFSRFRAKNGLSGFVVLHAGNLGRYQNFDTLLDAARLLRDRRKEITFVFVGDGAQKEHVAQRVDRERITNVRMYPFVSREDFSDMLASADVSLVTLEPGAEGLGVPSKFYSILASGRPSVAIVAPDCEVARVLAEADCGIRVTHGDPAELAEVLTGLCDSPDETERMAKNARRALLERYTTRHATQRFYETFTAATAAHSQAQRVPVTPRRRGRIASEDRPPAEEAPAFLGLRLPMLWARWAQKRSRS